MQWCVSYLRNPGPAENRGLIGVKRFDGKLYLNLEKLSLTWKMYLPDEPQPKLGSLRQAFGSVTTGERKSFSGIRLQAIDLELLKVWLEETDYADWHDIEKALHNVGVDNGLARPN